MLRRIAKYPIKNMRWTLAHINRINASHLARMKELGMYAAVHPWAVINGGINQRVFKDSASDMPPLETIQNSGIMWGLGSDGSRANQILPFTTLWWAVTGRMVGGAKVLRQTISREDAVMLDRDYLTIPADQIKDIKPIMTIVGGRIVYDAGAVRD